MKLIHLSRGMSATVDDRDFDLVSKFKWSVAKCGKKFYAKRVTSRSAGSKVVYMHRFLMNAKAGTEIDHVDGDGLNNQRLNMRFATRSQNNANRKIHPPTKSGYAGVHHNGLSKLWSGRIKKNRKIFWTKGFATPDDAFAARAELKRKLFGEFAS